MKAHEIVASAPYVVITEAENILSRTITDFDESLVADALIQSVRDGEISRLIINDSILVDDVMDVIGPYDEVIGTDSTEPAEVEGYYAGVDPATQAYVIVDTSGVPHRCSMIVRKEPPPEPGKYDQILTRMRKLMNSFQVLKGELAPYIDPSRERNVASFEGELSEIYAMLDSEP